MTTAQVHLALNHVPVLGAAFGLLVLTAAIVWRRGDVIRVAAGLFILAALAAVPTYLSGEPSEDVVERAVGDVEPWVEPHEEAALVSLILVETMGVMALGTLWVLRRRPIVPRPMMVATMVLALATAGSLGWTASLGGKINHPEIRAAGGMPPAEEGGEDD